MGNPGNGAYHTSANLSKDQLLLLRAIDQAAAGGLEVGVDDFLDDVLERAGELLGAGLVIQQAGGAPLWGRQSPDSIDVDQRTIVEIMGLGIEGLDGRLTAVPRKSILRRSSSLDDDYFKTLASQLSLFLRTRIQDHRESFLRDLSNEFFNRDLHPELCFQELARRLLEIFPKSNALRVDHAEVIQVLVPEAGGSTLEIRATIGTEVGTLVDPRDSVVGLVFLSHEPMPFVLGDPTEGHLRPLYKGFAGERSIRTELVVPLRRRERTVGALNLESTEPGAFTDLHVQYLLTVSRGLGSMVDALRRQGRSDLHMKLGIASVQSKYWESLGRMLRHDLRASASGVQLLAEGIETDCQALADAAGGNVPPGPDAIARLREIAEDARKQRAFIAKQEFTLSQFVGHFDDYLSFGQRDLGPLLQEAVSFARDQHSNVIFGGSVSILLETGNLQSIPSVYCSELFKIFLFNVVDNAMYWVRRIGDESHVGEVRVEVSLATPEIPTREINERVRIAVTDNGPGAPAEVLEALNSAVPTTITRREGGDGYALRALREYLALLGGSASFVSPPERGFRVVMEIPVYNQFLHRIENQ